MARKIITTEQLMKQASPNKTGGASVVNGTKKVLSTEELLGNRLPAIDSEPDFPEYLKKKVTLDKANAVYSSYMSRAMWGEMETSEALTKAIDGRDYWTKKAGDFEDYSFKEHPFKFAVGEAAQMLPYMFSSMQEGLKHGMATGMGFATIAAVAGQAGPQALAPEEIVTVPGAFAAGMTTGFTYGIMKNSIDREGGSMFGELVESGISEETARPLAVTGGVIIGTLEAFQFKLLSSPLKQAFKKVATSKVGKSAIAKAVGRYFMNVAGEVAIEDAQEITNLATEAIAAHIDEKPDAMPTFEELKERLIQTTGRSLAAMAVISAPGASIDVATSAKADITKIVKNKNDAQSLQEMTEPKKEEIAPEETEQVEIPDEQIQAVQETLSNVLEQSPEIQSVIEEAQGIEDIEGFIKEKSEELGIDEAQITQIKETVDNIKNIKPDMLQKLTEQGINIEQAEIANKAARNAREAVLTLQRQYKNAIAVDYKTKNIPDNFVSKKGGIKPIEVIRELQDAGIPIRTEKDLVQYLQGLNKQKTALDKAIRETSPDYIRRKKITDIKKTVSTFKQGVRRGEMNTVKKIKERQAQFIDMIQKSELEAKDKAKFLAAVKNANTAENLDKQISAFKDRSIRYMESSQKDSIARQIKTELKTTKPYKKGQKSVGKYDYESNVIFEKLRSYNTLSKENAETELMSASMEEFKDEISLILQRFLALKANGKTASVEIYEQVLKDIRHLKAVGKQAKDDADFEAKVKKEEFVQDSLARLEKIKTTEADKNTVVDNLITSYMRGEANLWSLFNAMFGTEFADANDPSFQEQKRDTKIVFKMIEAANEASVIYGIEEKAIFRKFLSMAEKKFQAFDFQGMKHKISKMDIINAYNAVKNDLLRERYINAYGEEQMLSLFDNLSEQDKALADYMMDVVQDYRHILNKRNIEVTGRDLGTVENYWVSTSEYTPDIFEGIMLQGETPSAMKKRSQSANVVPRWANAWIVFQKHIYQGEHTDTLSREYARLKRLFQDRRIRETIINKYGEDTFRDLNENLDGISLNRLAKRLDAISKTYQKFLNNWVIAKIASPDIFVKQLISMMNFTEVMPVEDWISHFSEGISNPRKTFDYMWKNIPYLQARFKKGYSEAVQEAMDGSTAVKNAWGDWKTAFTSLARAGDISAIIYGGYPVIKYHTSQGKSFAEASEIFVKATMKSQQAGQVSTLSLFQQHRGPWAQSFNAFKNTAHQYLRKMSDAIISYRNGDISKQQFAKTMTIYGIIQPMLWGMSGEMIKRTYSAIGSLIMGDDPEDVAEKFGDDLGNELLSDIIINLAVSPVMAIPILNDAANFGMRKIFGKPTRHVFSMPMLDDVSYALNALSGNISADDVIQALATTAEVTTAAPVKKVLSIYKYMFGDK